MKRLVVVTAGIVAGLVLATTAAAAVSPSYVVNGLEVAFTSTEGTFVGTGTGSGGDHLAWKAVVDHTLLSSDPSSPATITGGSLTALSYGNGLATLSGTFNGGTITYDTARSSTSSCGNQVYDLAGNVTLTAGSGAFTATLTHLRTRLFGSCITYGATVTGSLTVGTT